MDLSLELGQPFERLSEQMTEREFRQWARYAAKHRLPTRRMEMYLAQIAFLIARTMGGAKDAKFSDFIFEPREIEKPMNDLDAAKAAFGFNPVSK